MPSPHPDPQIRCSVLGPVQAWRGETEIDLGPPQQRAALTVLLLRQGRTVSLADLIDVIWGERPPATAVNVLHRYIGKLRRQFEPELPVRAAGRFLLRSTGGYRLELAPDEVDLSRFQQLTEQAREALDAGLPQSAVPLFVRALHLWQGPVAADLDPEVLAHPLFTAQEEDRLATVAALADAALVAGSPQEALPILRQAAVEHPWTESLQARLILTLAAAGQQAEALQRYEDVRERLTEELGIDPGAELRAAHQKVLRQELPRPVLSAVRPAHLPATPPSFSGREAEMRQAMDLLGPQAGAPMVIAAVNGMAGVGKSTFALHWAHQVSSRFPDGQLYVNLRGFDPSGDPLEPAAVIRGFLDALEVAPAQIPAGVDAQAALFRSLLTTRRMLVLLDNARDEEQVRPLLPGSAGHLVIVTSRNRLSGLVARDGAQPIVLGLPTMDTFRTALADRLGPERVNADPEAVTEIISRCGRLPLAVAIVTARAVANPTFPLTALAEELRETAGSLDAFTDSDPSTDARVAFSWSYRALSPGAARLFRLLALRPGQNLCQAAAAALMGLPQRQVRPLLTELTRAHLMTEWLPGRYEVHDLVAAYAAELLEDAETDEERRAARERVIDHYVHSAFAANRLIEPYRHPIDLPPIVEGAGIMPLATADAAMDWFGLEYPVLLAAVRQAAEHGMERRAWQLTWAIQQFFDRSGHWHDWIATLHVARDAAARSNDKLGLAHTHRGIGTVYSRLSRAEDSYRELNRSLELFGELGDGAAEAHLHLVLGAVKSRSSQRHRVNEAREHSRQALALFTAADSTVGRARSLNNLGHTSALLGDHQAALQHARAALDLHEQLGDRHGQAAAWDSVALALHRLGRHPEAIDCYQRALEMFTAQGNRYFLAMTSFQLGKVYQDEGREDRARQYWEQALDVLDDLDHTDAAQVRERLRQLGSEPEPEGSERSHSPVGNRTAHSSAPALTSPAPSGERRRGSRRKRDA